MGRWTLDADTTVGRSQEGTLEQPPYLPVMTEPANLEAPYMAVKEEETRPRSVLLSLRPPSAGPCCSPGAATASALRAKLYAR